MADTVRADTWRDQDRVREVPRARVHDEIAHVLYCAASVLDVGPGINPQWYFKPRTHICVEAHPPYVAQLQAAHGDDPRFVFLCGRWQDILPHLPDDSIDTATAIDVIEHLEREDGFALLEQLMRIVRHQIVISTPLGFYPQHYEPDERDRWGMDGGHWQTHRSGWTPDDLLALDRRWSAVVSPDYHTVDQHDQPLAEPWPAFWGIFTKSVPAHGRTLHDERQRAGRLGRFPAPIRDTIRAVRRRLS